MPDSIDSILGPEPSQPQETVDSVLGPAPKPSIVKPMDGPGSDAWFSQTTSGKILNAFGQGAKDGWGAEPLGLSQDTEDFLKKAGVFNDHKDGHDSLIKNFNEGFIRPAAVAAETAWRGLQAVTGGTVEAAEQIPGIGPTISKGIQAATDPGLQASLLGVGPIGEVAGTALKGLANLIPPQIARARSVGAIGEGEAGYMGTAERAPVDPEIAQAEEVRAAQEQAKESPQADSQAASPEPPDIHQVVRQQNPVLFNEYDDLSTRRDTFGRWMGELRDTQTEEVTKPYQDQISELNDKMEDATPRLQKKYAERIDDITEQMNTALDDARSKPNPDMDRVRQAYQEADYRMRDMAPDVAKAYRDAQEQIGPIEEDAPLGESAPEAEPAKAPESVKEYVDDYISGKGRDSAAHEQFAANNSSEIEAEFQRRATAENAPETAPTKAIEEPTVAPPETIKSQEVTPEPKYVAEIENDVAQKLQSAGRPEPEARAAAKVVSSYYETRAARFNGERGTAADLYNAEAPEIKAGQERARQPEMAQKAKGKIAINNGKKVITLFKDADASTFMHETGHQFLEDLLSDSEHPSATDQIKTDAQSVKDWLGAKDGETIKTRQHEKFARGFERYLMEGVAPSKGLALVFSQFKGWLTNIYQTVKNLKSPITDDIRSVFDRLLAEKPERTVIAPEREGSFADIHESASEITPPEKAHEVANNIRDERDAIASQQLEENDARLAGTSNASERLTTGSEEPDSNEPTEPATGENGTSEEPREISQSRGETSAKGPRSSKSTEPSGPNQPFGRSESDLIDKAGNIRLDNLNAPEDVNSVLRETAETNDEFQGARRGVVSDQEVIDYADAMGVEAKNVNLQKLRDISLNDGIPLAARIVAGRKMLIQSATAVRDAMARAADGTDADVLAYAQSKARHIMIQETMSAITAEIGRGLRAFRELKADQGLDEFIKGATGKTLFQLKEEAKLGKSLDTPQKVSKYLNDSRKPTFGNMLLEYWINGLISGPATHTTYMIGNTILGLWKAIPETAVAAGLGKARALLGGTETRVRLGEVGAQLKGAVKELPNALEAAGQAAKSGVTTLLPEEKAKALPFQPGTELVTPGQMGNNPITWHQLGAEAFGAIKGLRDAFLSTAELVKNGGVEDAPLIGLKKSNLGSIPDIAVKGINVLLVGTAIRLPGRAISAIHSFFRSANYSMSKAAGAYRAAAEANLEGDAFSKKVMEGVTNPTEEQMTGYRANATDLTLMGQGGEFTQALSRLTNASVNLPFVGDIKPLKFIDPFVHISSNIIDQSLLQRTPIGLFSSEVRNNLSGKNGPIARDYAQARMLVGTGLAITVGGLTAEGLVSGSGPSDPKESALWRAAGNQAHSVRIGDFWYDVHRLGPIGMNISTAADFYQVAHALGSEDTSKITSMLIHAISQNILDESFMRGPADLIQALTDHDRYGAAYVRNFLSSFVPYSVGMSQVAHAVDPYARQTRTVMDSMLAKVPYASENLLPRRDIWGDPVPSHEVLGAPGLSAIYATKINNDPVIQAMSKNGFFPAYPQRKIRGVELTDQQYDNYSRVAGRMAKTRLDQIVRQPGFAQMPVRVQHDIMSHAVSSSREAARTLIMMQSQGTDNDIMQKAVDNKTAQLH